MYTGLVQILNPLIGAFISSKSRGKLSNKEVKAILSRKYPKEYQAYYIALTLGLLAVSIGGWFILFDKISNLYNATHHIPGTKPTTKMIYTSLLLLITSIFFLGGMYWAFVLKLMPKRYKGYMLQQQVKSGYTISLETSMRMTYKINIILIPLTVIILFWVFSS